ncbi:MAG: hypothetical protein QXR73_00540 [Candidatus Micrarchaeaceae archaeon]
MKLKFYISSSDSIAAIKLANAISKVGDNPIISESGSTAPESVISDISNNIDDQTVAIVICQNPIKLALMANKSGYFDAVACSTSEDFRTALEEGANLITVQDKSGIISEIASRFSAAQGQQAQRPSMQKRQQKPMQKPDQKQKPAFSFRFPKIQPKPDAPNDTKPIWEKNKGIKKNLKDIFGIE